MLDAPAVSIMTRLSDDQLIPGLADGPIRIVCEGIGRTH